ncbi:MAG TPA: hypothetical protein VKU02_03265 [Gemmataceae bacterium]|nr:hypothetical protein [Gemmataceae bacterium]
MLANFPTADRLLVRQCQAGDPQAWEELEARVRERGQEILPKALGEAAGDKALMEEMIVDTLEALFTNEAVLEAFAGSGRTFDGFLGFLLNRMVKRHYQRWRRHLRRERHLPFGKLAKLVEVRWLPSMEQELLDRLTEAEKTYYEWAQRPHVDTPPCPFSASYVRQLQRRIAKKARRLFYED